MNPRCSLATFLTAAFVLQSSVCVNAQVPSADVVNFIPRFLGRGYDAVQGKYAHPQSVRAPIYELSLPEPNLQNRPGQFTYVPGNINEQEKITGASTTAYVQSLATTVGLAGSYGLFSGEVELSATSKAAGSTDDARTSIHDQRTIFSSQLTANAKVSPSVLNELNHDPNLRSLIKKYGTHYTAGLEFGARVFFTYSERKTSGISESAIEAKAAAAYATFQTSAALDLEKKNSETQGQSKTTLSMIGGDQVGLTTDNFESDGKREFITGQYSAWASSLNGPFDQQTCTISGFSQGGLKPLWGLPGLQEHRRVMLRDEINRYAKEQGQGVFDRIDPDIKVPVKHHDSVTFKSESEPGNYLGDDGGTSSREQAERWFSIGKRGLYEKKTTSMELKSGDVVNLALDGVHTLYAGRDAAYNYRTSEPAHQERLKWIIHRVVKERQADIRAPRGEIIYFGDRVTLQSVYHRDTGYPSGAYLQWQGDEYDTLATGFGEIFVIGKRTEVK